MGMWGAGLYDGDFAADLRASIAIIAKIKAEGDQLLAILLDQQGGEVSIDEEDGMLFWLVVGDQFERKGIVCPRVNEQALHIIDSGMDLERLRAEGLDARMLAKRERVLDELAKRLRSPRPGRKLPKSPTPPDVLLKTGEVYAFPTMAGWAVNAWMQDKEMNQFVPNGWGAMLIVDSGLAYGWIPWCAIASLEIDSSRCPSLDDVMNAQLLYHSQTRGATLCIPQKPHVKRMQLQLLGTLKLDPVKAKATVSIWCSLEGAISLGWAVSTAAFCVKLKNSESGIRGNDLLVGTVEEHG